MSDRVAGRGTAAHAAPERIAVAFVRRLRAASVDVPIDSTVIFVRALAMLGLANRDGVYWAGRSTLVRRPEDIAAYDEVFESFWQRRAPTPSPKPEPLARPQLSAGVENPPDEAPGEDTGQAAPALTISYSRDEVLRHRAFDAYSEAEWAEAARLIAALRLHVELRRSRRLTATSHRRARPDVHRSVRRALRTHAEPLVTAWREPSSRPRRLVLLVDVSGSMEPFARALLRFAHAAVSARDGASVEVFTIGTRLTRVTRELAWRDPDHALEAVSRAVPDLAGGTRLGEAIRAFNDAWGTRGMARGAVVVLLSDGWERGDADLLGSEIARLHRVSHRLVWVNPLKATEGYAPLARGMAAALPHVDEFVEGHSLDSLEKLAALVGSAGQRSR